MEWVETTGRTIEAALDAALDELGVDEQDVEYEVLQEPRGGLLGRLGGGEARVRARVKPISREKPGERQRRNRRPGGTRPKGDRAKAPESASGPDVAAGSRPGGATRSRSRRRSGRGSGAADSAGRQATGTNRTSANRSTPAGGQEESLTVNEVNDVPVEEQAEAAEQFARGLVDAFDLGADVATVIEDDSVLVEITGANLGLLVGPRGATLTAIEELVRTVVQRQTDGRGARIHVDVGGYRAKRRAALEDFTRSLAAKALETGRAQRLEPMSAADRKIVHDTAAEIDGVETESEGEDPRRRVVLRPA